MSFSWTDSIPDDLASAGFDVGDLSLVGKLWQAYAMRRATIDNVSGAILYSPVAGADLQYAGSVLPSGPTGSFSIGVIQRQLEFWANADIGGGAARPVFDPAIVDSPPTISSGDINDYFTAILYSIPAFRTAAGIDAAGFRRKKPREITDLAATTDTDGNTCASGMKAFFRVTDLTTFAAHPAEAGRVVKYNGATWAIPTPPESVDVLDSQSSAPSHCAAGYFTAGDYMGGWLYREVRDGLNQIYCSVVEEANLFNCHGADATNNSLQRMSHATDETANLSNAKTRSTAAYDAIATGSPKTYNASSSGPPAYIEESAWGGLFAEPANMIFSWQRRDKSLAVGAPDSYEAELQSFQEYFEFGAPAMSDLVSEIDADVLMVGLGTYVPGLSRVIYNITYDDSGLGFPLNTPTLAFTTKITLDFGGSPFYTPKLGDESISPAWGTAPVFPSPPFDATGFSVNGMYLDHLAIIKFAYPLGSYAAIGDTSPGPPDCTTVPKRCKRTFDATVDCAAGAWAVTFVSQTCDDSTAATGWTANGTDAYGRPKKRCIVFGPICTSTCADPSPGEYPPPPADAIADSGRVYRTYEVKPVCTGVPAWGTVTQIDRTCSMTAIDDGWHRTAQGSEGDVYQGTFVGERCCPPFTDPAVPAPPPTSLIKCPSCWYDFKELLNCTDSPVTIDGVTIAPESWGVIYVGLNAGSPTSADLGTDWTDDGPEAGLSKRIRTVKGPIYTGSACPQPPDPRYAPTPSVFVDTDCVPEVCGVIYQCTFTCDAHGWNGPTTTTVVPLSKGCYPPSAFYSDWVEYSCDGATTIYRWLKALPGDIACPADCPDPNPDTDYPDGPAGTPGIFLGGGVCSCA